MVKNHRGQVPANVNTPMVGSETTEKREWTGTLRGLSLRFPGAVASELYNGRRSHLTPIDHRDDTSESIFNYRFRRVYFE